MKKSDRVVTFLVTGLLLFCTAGTPDKAPDETGFEPIFDSTDRRSYQL